MKRAFVLLLLASCAPRPIYIQTTPTWSGDPVPTYESLFKGDIMAKGNPADLRGLAEGLARAIDNHPDAIRNNPDIHADLKAVRDKTAERYAKVAERPAQ